MQARPQDEDVPARPTASLRDKQYLEIILQLAPPGPGGPAR